VQSSPDHQSTSKKSTLSVGKNGSWVPKGSTAKIQGQSVHGGMFYVYNGDVSPFPPAIGIHQSASRVGDYTLDLKGYWPSYAHLSVTERGSFLKFLDSGR